MTACCLNRIQKDYYDDRDIKPEESIFLKITLFLL